MTHTDQFKVRKLQEHIDKLQSKIDRLRAEQVRLREGIRLDRFKAEAQRDI